MQEKNWIFHAVRATDTLLRSTSTWIGFALPFCCALWYSKWSFRVNDKGLRLRYRASLTQNSHLSGDSQAKVRVDLFGESLAPLGNLVEPIHGEIWISWREIIKNWILADSIKENHANVAIYSVSETAKPNTLIINLVTCSLSWCDFPMKKKIWVYQLWNAWCHD